MPVLCRRRHLQPTSYHQNMHRRWLLAAAASVLVVAGAAAYGLHWQHEQRLARERAAAEKARATPPAPVEISAAGKIQARNVVNVPAPIEGVIDEYLVTVGEQVFEGEVLARIRNTGLDAAQASAQADLEKARARISDLESQLIAARLDASRTRSDAARAKAEYDRTQKIYERQKMLLDAGATPRLTFEKAQQEFETAKSDYEGYSGRAQASEDKVASLTKEIESANTLAQSKNHDVENAQAHLAGGDVRSPTTGMVVALHGKPGDQVDPGIRDLVSIAVDLSALVVVVDTDPATAQHIRQGQPALIEVAEAPAAFEGAVREIKSGQVFVDFTSPSAVIRPGLTAQVKFKVG
jgi:multidrug resistance efflux pump